MKLLNAEIRPGKILEINEDLKGYIKASAPGLFSESDQEYLPYIMPFFGLHSNTFSMPTIGEEIWLLNIQDNLNQLFWFKKDNYSENLKNLLENNILEVLCYKNFDDDNNATIYLNGDNGWYIINYNGIINIDNSGQIHITNKENFNININNDLISLITKNNTQILLKDDEISLITNQGGTIKISPDIIEMGQANYKGVLGEELKNLLDKIIQMLIQAGTTPVIPYSPISAFSSASSLLTQTTNILSKNVKLS